MKPKLLPLIKHLGWFNGLIRWHLCHRHGCYWIAAHIYPTNHAIPYSNGGLWSTGMVKFQCHHCQSVKLTRIFVNTLPNGLALVQTEDGLIVNLSNKDQ
jgi:hypothetical protein